MGSKAAYVQLYLSNRLENLADALIANLQHQAPHPLLPDTVVVQNRGMSRWLNLKIAEKTGIQMNTRFLYPGKLIDSLISGTVPGLEGGNDPFSQNALFWRIYESLPSWSSHPAARSLKRYLEADTDSVAYLRRYQLARQVSRQLYELQIYRPHLLRDWSSEKDPTDWRPLIWRSLDSQSKAVSLPNRFKLFEEAIAGLKEKPEAWPHDLHIFAISSLPPVYLNLLKQVSHWTPVSIYLTQPSPLYWGDQLSRKSRSKKPSSLNSADEGHVLLGNLGQQGQDFLNLLTDAEVFTRDESEYFEEQSGDSLLSHLQRDLYHLTPPSESKPIIHNTRGIEVHVCHSTRREIESLKDQLLMRFEEDPGLTPDQVIIMAPDIETYAPSIRSVFGNPQHNNVDFIPYSIADYGTGASGASAHALIKFLELFEGRFTSNEVLNFLSIPVIGERFKISEDDWDTLRRWIKDTKIHWGLDQVHREKVTGISFGEYSWKQGIDQLVSGYLVHPHEDSDLEPLIPHPDIEGNAIPTLTNFLEFWQFIESHQNLATSVLTSTEWLDKLGEIITFLFSDNESHGEESQYLFRLLSDLEKEVQISDTKSPLTLKVIKATLEDRLSQDIQAGRFFSGTVTFCSLLPMRNVPAKFIGLIGMGEGAFPRQDYESEFSAFPDGRKLGDRSRRSDDRYLFLESILSARTRLYISYTGIDNQTLVEQPASIVVEELLDTLDEYYLFPNSWDARKTLVKQEPLQAFSPAYFNRNQPISYSLENLEAAKALIAANAHYRGLAYSEAGSDTELPAIVSLVEFQRFFNNPSRQWLSHSLEINFPYQEETLEEVEPLESNSLIEYHWGSYLLEHPELLTGEKSFLLRNTFPVGTLRELALQKILPDVRGILQQRNLIISGNTYPIQIELKLGNFSLLGKITGVAKQNYVKMRYGKIRPTDLLAAWIEHLCISAEQKDNQLTTFLIGKNQSLKLNPIQDPVKLLQPLADLFACGLKTPLRFFPESSFAYAKGKHRPSPRARQTPQQFARNTFLKNPDGFFGQPGEAYDVFNKLCHPDSEAVVDEIFETIADLVFLPILEHTEGELP